ncbi:cell division protein FtsK [Microlunatus elymi]|uniref:Cell division protein FtsK n=1 Tax=Microlunatus elymi TaxID=2596828 RepID=A0A516PV27_9ACTN|nr:FtsK/SpoIIIE domain-containing protein [Microlunatus elymi]QDP94801.1 cell division protein FtsK [Microlunatus elymi]
MSPTPFTRGQATDTTPVRVHTSSLRVGLVFVVAVWLIRRLAGLVMIIVRTPLLLAAALVIIGLAVLWSRFGTWPAVVAAVLLVVGLVVWRLRWPAWFTRTVGNRARSLGRWFWIYRRSWQPAMITANLAQHRDGTEYLPQLLDVTSTRWVDRVRVRLLPGQTLDDWAEIAHRLAQSFAVDACRVHSTDHVQVIEVWALHRDPLTDTVAPTDPADLDLDRLELGRAESGDRFRLGLLGHHVLVVGATGSGKGSVIWSMIGQLAPGLVDGSVRLWVIDPKGGMELAPGEAVFDRFAHGTTATDAGEVGLWEGSFAGLLDDAVEVMRDRQDRLRGVTRLHQPTPGDPLIVIIIDELASLTAYVSDRSMRKRIDASLSLLLSQGRAVGVSVVAAVQDPRKDTIPVRDLFPTRICLRVTEPEHVTLALGAGTRAKGAQAERIRHDLPGVGFVQVDGIPEPTRVRFAHITDPDIAAMVTKITTAADHDQQLHAVGGAVA